MKTIGMVGGMSWESSAEYYRQLNEQVKTRLGPTHSAEIVIYSLDFHPVARMEQNEQWSELAALLVAAIARLERAGAELALVASNTAHKVAELVRPSIHIPFLHIADAAAGAIEKAQLSTVALLGTRFVMEQDFYRDRLRLRGIEALIPNPAQRDYIHNVIFNELCVGKLLSESRKEIQAIILDLHRAGAQAAVLACTELPLLIRDKDTPVRLFDTTAIHVDRAVSLALEGQLGQQFSARSARSRF